MTASISNANQTNLPNVSSQAQPIAGLSSVNMGPTNFALYIGDLHEDVTEAVLFQFVATSGINIISARVCRANTTKKSLNYGYLNFASKEDADKAMEVLNYQPLMGRPVRISYSQRDPSIRKSGKGNIIVKNLPKAVNELSLLKSVEKIGPVSSLALKSVNGSDTKNAYIQFENEEHAATALQALDKTQLSGVEIEARQFVAQKERFEKRDMHDRTFVNCYVKNLPKEDFKTEEQLEKYFSKAGEITSCKLVRDGNDQPTGAAFICFVNHEDAVKAVEEYDGKCLENCEEDKPLVFTRFQRRNERTQSLKEKFDGMSVNKNSNNNIYIKNLDGTVTDETLAKEFSNFGKVISAKVMTHENGQSRGFGFVSFENPKDAATAIEKKHGAYFFSKPLHVEFAQKKEERQQTLRNHFRFPQYMVSPQPMPYMLKQPGSFFTPQNYMPLNNYQMYSGAGANGQNHQQNRFNNKSGFNHQMNNHHHNGPRQHHFHNPNHSNGHAPYGVDNRGMNKPRGNFQQHQQQHQKPHAIPLTDSQKNNFGQEFNAILRDINKPHLLERGNKIVGVFLASGQQHCQKLLDNPELFKQSAENVYQQLQEQEMAQQH